MEESEIEKRKRFDLVLGIMIAAGLSFVVNLLAMLYYDIFITETFTWGKVDHSQIYIISFLLLLFLGFLEFFIQDYENDVEVTKGFLKRFFKYFFLSSTSGKIIRILVGLYLTVGLFAVLYAFFAKIVGYAWATPITVALLLWGYLKLKRG